MGDDNPADHALSFQQPLLAGSTVLVFTTDININGTPVGTGAPSPIVISDSGAGTYRALVTVNNHWDWDAVRVFARTNVAAGALAVRTVWQTNQWHGLMIAEIAGAPASPRITAIANNFDARQTADAASSGVLDLGQSPALLVGFAFNASASTNDQGAPFAGTGFTAIGPRGIGTVRRDTTQTSRSAGSRSAQPTGPDCGHPHARAVRPCRRLHGRCRRAARQHDHDSGHRCPRRSRLGHAAPC